MITNYAGISCVVPEITPRYQAQSECQKTFGKFQNTKYHETVEWELLCSGHTLKG